MNIPLETFPVDGKRVVISTYSDGERQWFCLAVEGSTNALCESKSPKWLAKCAHASGAALVRFDFDLGSCEETR